jgi:hypothetical protein
MTISLVNECSLSKTAPSVFALLFFCLLVAPVQIAAAQEKDDKSDEYIEEITSYGRKSLLSFRVEMVEAEKSYYDLYNTLNDDDEFDVICKKASDNSSRSRITRRVCKDRLQDGLLPQVNWAAINRKKLMVLDKMEELANENPELREALFSLTRISQKFEEEKKTRCEGDILCRDKD